MKLVRVGAALLALGTLAACDGVFSSRAAAGTFDGEWDGATWRGNAYAVLQHDTMTVVGHRPDPTYFYDEYVQARVHFTGPGTYALTAEQGALSQIVGGDAGSFTGAVGTLVVKSYDAGSHAVSGELRLDAAGPETWHVTGSFQASVYPSAALVPNDTHR